MKRQEIMRLNSWQQVLDHALERGEVMDELNAVTSLHRAAKLYREDASGKRAERSSNRSDLDRCLKLFWL
eukprot:g32777.t1